MIKGKKPSCLLRLCLLRLQGGQQAAGCWQGGNVTALGQGLLDVATRALHQPAILCCSATKSSQKQGYKSHLDELPWVFLNCSFLWILRLAKKQNFHSGRCQHLVCGFQAELGQEAKRVGFLPK